MKCTVTCHDRPARPGIKPFWTKGGDPATRPILFDRKLLMHAINTAAAIVYEISNAKTDISLRRASITPLENRFGQTRIGAGGRRRVSSEHLRLLIRQVGEQIRQDFNGPRRLSRFTKREMVQWIEGHWEEIGPMFAFVAASQRRMSTPQLPPFLSAKNDIGISLQSMKLHSFLLHLPDFREHII
jgi:hypothetical protein